MVLKLLLECASSVIGTLVQSAYTQFCNFTPFSALGHKFLHGMYVSLLALESGQPEKHLSSVNGNMYTGNNVPEQP